MELPNIFDREVTPLSVSTGEAIYSEVEETPFFALTAMRTMIARLRRGMGLSST